MVLGCQRRPSQKRCYLNGDLNDGGEKSPLVCTENLNGRELGTDNELEKARTRGESLVG